MKKSKHLLLILVLSMFAGFAGQACSSSEGGASEVGNPPSALTRTFTGSVPESGDASVAALRRMAKYVASTCAADTVLATNSADEDTSATIAADCSFSIDLTVDDSYVLAFTLEGETVATLSVLDDSLNAFGFFYVSEGDAVDMGEITFTQTLATPQFNPQAFNDYDGDGTLDSEDDDDDGDGTLDTAETDCNGNGTPDDSEGIICRVDIQYADGTATGNGCGGDEVVFNIAYKSDGGFTVTTYFQTNAEADPFSDSQRTLVFNAEGTYSATTDFDIIAVDTTFDPDQDVTCLVDADGLSETFTMSCDWEGGTSCEFTGYDEQ